jgi:lysophospholipase L1-like esterase
VSGDTRPSPPGPLSRKSGRGGTTRGHRLGVVGAVVIAALAMPATGLAQTTRYIAFGDSITEGFGDDERPDGKGYPPRLEVLLQRAGEDAEVLNRGLGSERTMEGLTRLDDVLDEDGGDVLLLMEGTNDISRAVSLNTIRFNLAEMARKAEAAGLEVVHATVIPRLARARFDNDNVQTRRLNQRVRDLAGTSERLLVDPFEELFDIPNLYNRYYIPGSDPVGHLNPEGYDLLAQIFFDALQEVDTVPPVVGLMDPEIGDQEISPDAVIILDVWDFGTGLDLQNLTLLINRSPVTATATGDTTMTTLTYDPPQPLAGPVEIGLRARDQATPPNQVDRQIARVVVAGTTFLPGDLTQDGRVDGTDLVRLALRFGARNGEQRFQAAADLNGDRVIDGMDLAVLASNFGRASF